MVSSRFHLFYCPCQRHKDETEPRDGRICQGTVGLLRLRSLLPAPSQVSLLLESKGLPQTCPAPKLWVAREGVGVPGISGQPAEQTPPQAWGRGLHTLHAARARAGPVLPGERGNGDTGFQEVPGWERGRRGALQDQLGISLHGLDWKQMGERTERTRTHARVGHRDTDTWALGQPGGDNTERTLGQEWTHWLATHTLPAPLSWPGSQRVQEDHAFCVPSSAPSTQGRPQLPCGGW